MTAGERPRVSALVVSYNTAADTVEAIRSLLDTTTAEAQVVVVDNGSSDGSADAIRRALPHVVVDAAGRNLGFAAAVNRAAALATGDYLLLLNPDTACLPGSIDALLTFAAAHPRHGVYGGRTLRDDGTLEPSSCWGAMTLWSLACFASGASTALKKSRVFDPESLGRWRRDSIREVPVVTGCLLLVRRDTFLALGGMDERFFLYGEDAAFSARAIAAGLRPVIVPEATIVHSVGGSTSDDKMSMVLAGKTTLMRLTWSPRRAAVGCTLLVIGVTLRAALERLRRAPRRTWTSAFARRSVWLPGYPSATAALFGADAAATQRAGARRGEMELQ